MRKHAAVAFAVALAAGVTGCGTGSGESDTSPDVADGEDSAMEFVDVDPARFDLAGDGRHHGFLVDTDGPGAAGSCVFYDATVSCRGDTDEPVPEAQSYLGSTYNGVRADADGVGFAFYEGSIGPTEFLDVGQRISNGVVTCEVPEAQTVRCSSTGGAFEVRGPTQEIALDSDR